MARFSGASALTVTLFLSITACFSEDSVTDQPESILVQILGSKYTTLVKLLADADLLSDLESDERFNAGVTVFATSDQYFVEKVSPSVLEFLQQPSNIGLLRQVLLSHIVTGKIGARSWYPGETVKTFSGNDAHLYLDSGDLKVNNAVVKEFGVLEAADGVVHSLEGFLVPEDIEDAAQGFKAIFEEPRREIIELQATAAPAPTQSPLPPAGAPAPGPSAPLTFEELLSALQELAPALFKLLTQYPDVAKLLEGLIASGSPVTLFAPTDASINGANFTGYNVTTVLLNHVVSGGPYTYDELLVLAVGPSPSRRLLQTNTLTTLSGSDLTLTKDSSGTLLANNVTVAKGLVDSPQVGAVQVDGVLIPANAKLTTTTSSPPPPPPSSGSKFGASVILALTSLAFGGALVL